MMHKSGFFGYFERESFAVLQLPYEVRNIVMMILLPRSLDGIEELQKQLKLTPGLLKELKKELRQSWVRVALPKFKCKYSNSMKDILHKQGLRKVFKMGADLGGISDSKKLNLLDVVHEAIVEVDEKGGRAVEAYHCTGGCNIVREFIVDRPFLFAIHDKKNDVILFWGRIGEP